MVTTTRGETATTTSCGSRYGDSGRRFVTGLVAPGWSWSVIRCSFDNPTSPYSPIHGVIYMVYLRWPWTWP